MDSIIAKKRIMEVVTSKLTSKGGFKNCLKVTRMRRPFPSLEKSLSQLGMRYSA